MIGLQFNPVANDRTVKAFFLSRIGIVKDNIDFPVAYFSFEFRQKPHFCLKSQYLLVFVAYKQVNIPAFFPVVGSRAKQVNGGFVPEMFLRQFIYGIDFNAEIKRVVKSIKPIL